MSNLTGRCNITVCIDIPVATELAAPLAENCIWRQVRGSGAEISGSDGPATATEKVKSTAISGIVIFPNSLSGLIIIFCSIFVEDYLFCLLLRIKVQSEGKN